jgi:hypothetical protein
MLQCLWLLAMRVAFGQTSPGEEWIDKTHSFMYDTLWRSAMGLDRKLHELLPESESDQSLLSRSHSSIRTGNRTR